MKKPNHFFASCPRGCEDLLEKELNSLGVESTKGRGGVHFKGEDKDALKIVINSRIASRVFKEVRFFFIDNEKDIYKHGKDIWWEKYISKGDTFKITTLLDGGANAHFSNSLYLSQVLKDSLCDHMVDLSGTRPDVDTDNPSVSILQRIEKTRKDFIVKVYIDLCGRSLDKRGYRDSGHRAPLRENLAAALLMSTDWNKEDILMEPMCGSGTILIEAILYKLNIPPSYLYLKDNKNPYAFLKQKWFKESGLIKWYEKATHSIITNAEKKIEEQDEISFIANDNDDRNIALCIKHLRKCFGNISFIQFESKDFFSLSKPLKEPKVIICNPPYGERLKEEEINEFYYQIGETLKNKYQGSEAYIFTLHGPLRNNIRLKPTMKKEFFNGNLDCRLFKYVIE